MLSELQSLVTQFEVASRGYSQLLADQGFPLLNSENCQIQDGHFDSKVWLIQVSLRGDQFQVASLLK